MIIETKKLKSAISTIMPGIESGSVTNEGGDLVIFMNSKMLSYNGKVAVSIPFAIDAKCGIKAKDLYSLVSKLKEESVELDVDATANKIKVKSGKLKATLNMQDISVIEKILGKMKFGEDKPIPENFVDATKLVTIADNKTPLKGFAVGKIGGRTHLVSTDKARISMCELAADMDQCLVNDDLVNMATSFGKITTYSIAGPWFHLGYESGMHFSILRSDDSNFPFEKMGALAENLATKTAEAKFTFPATLKEVAERVTTLGAVDSNARLVCEITLSDKSLTLKASKSTGSAEESIDWAKPIGIEGELSVQLPYKTLLAIAEKSSSCKIVEMNEKLKALVVTNNSYTMISSCTKV